MQVMGMAPIPQDGRSHTSVTGHGRTWNLRDLFVLDSCLIDARRGEIAFLFSSDDGPCALIVNGVRATQVGDLPEVDDVVDLRGEGVDRLDSFSINRRAERHGGGDWFTLTTEGGFVLNVQGESVTFAPGSRARRESVPGEEFPRGSFHPDLEIDMVSIDLRVRSVRMWFHEAGLFAIPDVDRFLWSSWRDLSLRAPTALSRSGLESRLSVTGSARDRGMRMEVVSSGRAPM
jgi:hypothetical protein